VREDVARDALRLASYKLPIRTQFITKSEVAQQ
jgi:ribosomal protein L16/L10AE